MAEGWEEVKFRRASGGARGSEQARSDVGEGEKRRRGTGLSNVGNSIGQKSAPLVPLRRGVVGSCVQSGSSQYGGSACFELSRVFCFEMRVSVESDWGLCRGTGTAGEEISGRAGEREEAGNEGGAVGRVRWGKGLAALPAVWVVYVRHAEPGTVRCCCSEGPPRCDCQVCPSSA